MKRLVPFAFLLLLLLTTALAACSSQPLPVKPTPTASAQVKANSQGERVIAGGKVVPSTSSELAFPVGGVVAKLSAAVGDHVQAGAILAQLDDTVIQNQITQAKAQVQIARQQEAQAAAQVQLAEKQLAQAKAGATDADTASAQAALNAAYANYEQVKRGPSADTLAQLQANVDNAKAALDQAQAAYDRIGGSSNPSIGMTPQALQLQQATNTYKVATAALADAKSHPTAAELAAANAQIQQAQVAVARLNPASSAVDIAQATLDAARAGQALAQAQVTFAQAAADTAAAQARGYVLAAPFAGTVITSDLQPGEYASPGLTVMRLADTSEWQIETTDLTELNIAGVAVGTPVSITFDAIPGLDLAGKVTQIRPYGESKQGDIVYTAVITPDLADPRLLWNMTAKVTIEAK